MTCARVTNRGELAVYSVGALGWTSGVAVGIGLDTNEIGSTEGLTFNTLVLTLYNSAGVALGSFRAMVRSSSPKRCWLSSRATATRCSTFVWMRPKKLSTMPSSTTLPTVVLTTSTKV